MGPLNPVFHGTILTFFPLNKNIYEANKAPIISTPIASPNIRRMWTFFLDGDCWTGGGAPGGGNSDGDGDGDGEVKDSSCLFMEPFFEYLK